MISVDHSPGLMPHIPALWVFLSVDPDGDEAVCAFQTSVGWMPMVAADEMRLAMLRGVAEGLIECGTTLRLVKFTAREDLEVITACPS